MSGIRIRNTAIEDVPNIVEMHADGFGPWTALEIGCRPAIQHRLDRPFICQVAEQDGQAVGHAEWIVGEEPGSDRFLYLGMIQIRPDRRGHGIGKVMLEHGRAEAESLGGGFLRTVPEEDVETFYARCGFSQTGHITESTIPVEPRPVSDGWESIGAVPADVARNVPMRIGWTQACATHTWEIANRPMNIADQTWHHPTWTQPETNTWLQLRYANHDSALPIVWSSSDTPIGVLVHSSLHFADGAGIESLYLAFRDDDRPADLKVDATPQIVDRV